MSPPVAILWPAFSVDEYVAEPRRVRGRRPIVWPVSDSPESLFHYTTAEGLLGILNSSQLWASDLRFLNDVREGLYAKQLLLDAVAGMPNPVLDPNHWAYRHGQSAVDAFAAYHRLVIDQIRTSIFGVFVACFCESGDLLSQWRAYGSDHGYAVEFSAASLETALAGRPFLVGSALHMVQYGESRAQEMVGRALESVRDTNLNHPGVKAWHKAVELTAMLATVKDPGFQEESEWRLIGVLDPYSGRPPKAKLDESGIRFRATPIAIVPYIELSVALNAIVSIRIGPGRYGDVRQAGVEALLSAIGLKAKVVRSAVPLRS